MIQIEEIDLKKAIQWGLGSQGIWTPELEDVILKEIKDQALRQPAVVGQSEQLKAFQRMVNKKTKGYLDISDELIDKLLKSL